MTRFGSLAFRGVLAAAIASAALLPTAAALGQQAGQAENGFRIYSSSFSAGYDTGISTAEGTLVGDTLFDVVPGALVFGTTTPSTDFKIIYEPEFEIFRQETELNSWNHAAATAVRIEPNRDWTVGLGGTYLRTNDRSRQTNGLTLAPRGTFIEGRAYGNAEYRFNERTSVQFGADGVYSETPAFVGLGEAAAIQDLTSTMRAGLTRALGRRHSVSVSYTRLHTRLLNADELEREDPQRDATSSYMAAAGYSFSTPSGFSLSASLGFISPPESETDEGPTYSLSGRLEKSWDALSMGGGYSRSLAALLRLDESSPADQIRDPLLSTNISESVDFGVSGQLSRRFSVGQRAQWARTSLSTSTDHLDTVSVGATLAVHVGNRFAPFASASYWRQNATDFLPAISRTRVTGGLHVYFGSSTLLSRSTRPEPARALLPTSRIQ